MDATIAFASYFALVSVSVERLLDICKTSLLTPFFGKFPPYAYQVLTVAFGTVFAVAAPPPNLDFLPDRLIPLVAGLLVSCGSGLWHDVLSVFTSYKKSAAQ